MSKRKHEQTLRTQIGQYGMVPLWVILATVKEPRALQLYALLMAQWADRVTGKCWPDREKHLVPTMGCSLSTVDRAIAVLKDIGALRTVLQHHATGAVAGMDFYLIQVDPAVAAQQDLPVTGDKKDEAHLSVTDDKKDATGLSVTGDKKADGQNVTGDGQNVTSDSHNDQPESNNQNQEQERTSAESTPTRAEAVDPLPETPEERLERERSARRFPPYLDDYFAGYVARFTTDPADPQKPVITPGKDAKLLDNLAALMGPASLRRLLVHRDDEGTVTAPGWFFRTPDPWIRNTGYTVGVLRSCANLLQRTYQPPSIEDGTVITPWSRVLDRMQTRVNRSNWHVWFKPTALIGVEVARIVVRVPNRLHAKWLERHHGEEVARTVVEELGAGMTVVYISAEDEPLAREALNKATVADREQLKTTVLTALRTAHPNFEQHLTQNDFLQTARTAMLRAVVDVMVEKDIAATAALVSLLRSAAA